MNARTKLKYLLIAAFFLLVLGYGSYQMRNLINHPVIIIDSPMNGASLTAPLITITGRTDQIAKLFINGNKLITDHTGRFESQLLLAHGYNIIQLNGEDRFGRKVEKKLELILN